MEVRQTDLYRVLSFINITLYCNTVASQFENISYIVYVGFFFVEKKVVSKGNQNDFVFVCLLLLSFTANAEHFGNCTNRDFDYFL